MSRAPAAKRLMTEELSEQQRAVLQMAWDGLDVQFILGATVAASTLEL